MSANLHILLSKRDCWLFVIGTCGISQRLHLFSMLKEALMFLMIIVSADTRFDNGI